MMEDFSAEHLQQLVKRIGEKQIDNLRHPQPAKTARGQKVASILQNRGQYTNMNNQNFNQPNKAHQQQDSQNNLDSVIRQAMGELVKKFIQEGKTTELQKILLEHKTFIDDILSMLSKS